MPLAWKEDFTIGVLEIDTQHQQLFGNFDHLLKAIEAGKGPQELQSTFTFLDDYVRRHFKTEEDFQHRFNYPHVAMHSAEHRSFEAKLDDLKARLNREGPSEALAHLTSNVLVQWLIEHICKTDKALASFIIKHKTEEWEWWIKHNF